MTGVQTCALPIWFTITTGSGDDTFATGFSDDVISLGNGNDSVNTYGGHATVDGGTGVDHWQGDYTFATNDFVLDLNTASLTQDIGGGNFVEGIERVTLFTGSGNDSFVTLYGLLTDGFFTGAGNDTVVLRGGQDFADMGLGTTDDDHLIVDWSLTIGDVTEIGRAHV